MLDESELINILKSYSIYDTFLSAQKYAKDFFNPDEKITICSEAECRQKMDLIERLIKLLEPSDAYTLLHLHYIKNIPIEKCAECMNISTRTAFRLKKKAHETIIKKLQKGQ